MHKSSPVIDVHSTWCGNCKAITNTFQRIYFEYTDQKPIRFLVADAEKILTSISSSSTSGFGSHKNDVEQDDSLGAGAGLDAERDTAREKYKQILTKYAGKSKPTFLFYKVRS